MQIRMFMMTYAKNYSYDYVSYNILAKTLQYYLIVTFRKRVVI